MSGKTAQSLGLTGVMLKEGCTELCEMHLVRAHQGTFKTPVSHERR